MTENNTEGGNQADINVIQMLIEWSGEWDMNNLLVTK